MNKFYEISTDEYTPNSHENQYLFNRFDQITNFITLYIDGNNKFILAKPIKNEYSIELYSPYSDLKDVRQNTELANYAYSVYFEFASIIEQKISELEHAIDLDKKTWASILAKVFNSQDNLIFSNGKEISIVWGWKFNNNQIFRPNLNYGEVNKGIKSDVIVEEFKGVEEAIIDEPVQLEEIQNEDIVPIDDDEQENTEEYIIEELPQEIEVGYDEDNSSENGFLNFLKWFAGNYWWILIVLLVLIALIFTFKSL